MVCYFAIHYVPVTNKKLKTRNILVKNIYISSILMMHKSDYLAET